MSILFSLQCNVCSRTEALHGVTHLYQVIKLQQPLGRYAHVCNSCFNDLEKEQLESEALEWQEVQP